MAIRLSSNCTNCEHLGKNKMCQVHQVNVSGNYTCDQFEMKMKLVQDRNCTSCNRYQETDCLNPTHAAPGMLCGGWVPRAQAS